MGLQGSPAELRGTTEERVRGWGAGGGGAAQVLRLKSLTPSRAKRRYPRLDSSRGGGLPGLGPNQAASCPSASPTSLSAP